MCCHAFRTFRRGTTGPDSHRHAPKTLAEPIYLETYNYLAVSGYSGQRIEGPCTRGREMDPNPDYDASDELEYGMSWFAWILRGVYPPPAYPPV